MSKLYVLPFDHRSSFAKMFGFEYRDLGKAEAVVLKDYKHLIYEGFLAALKKGVLKEEGAILVDEELGAEIHKEARAAGITRLLTVEKSGQEEFDFEYGSEFGRHIQKIKPAYAKALVRYDPGGDKELNDRQAARLKHLGEFCKKNGCGFLVELLVVSPKEALRWEAMRGSVVDLRERGVEPDIWKLEGLENEEEFARVVEETQRNAKKEVNVIVLGRGESGEKVRRWLEAAAKVPGVVGIAVGRTIWSQPLLDFAAKKISRTEAAERIANRYKEFVDVFEAAGR